MKTNKIFFWVLLAIIGSALLSGCDLHYGVLHPKGIVAKQERKLLFDSMALMLIVVIPVIVMSFAFVYHYRDTHKTRDYQPNWAHNVFLEAIWWTVPCVIIVVLGVMTWRTSHSLDPYRKLQIPGKPLLIEAVSLRWKWLFIYPEQNIATVNYLEIPKDRQVEFWITSDAPMSAFFIPQLGSQIYSMAGMRTRLHLVANEIGVYEGMNSQYSGMGFSDMRFKVHVTDTPTFDAWVQGMQAGISSLDIPAYQKLVAPSIADKPVHYSPVYPDLFNRIMDQYTKPNMQLH